MKIRSGFVSNSSSSSFIIAVKNSKTRKCKACGHVTHNFLSMIKNNGNYSETEVSFEGYDDVVAAYDDWMCFDETIEEDMQDRAKFIKKIDKYKDAKEYTLAFVDISYNDEVTKNMMDELVNRGEIVTLFSNEDW